MAEGIKAQPISTAKLHWPLIIAGSCAAESEQQTAGSIEQALQKGVDVVRISLVKPRTKPGFDGVKEEGLPWLTEASNQGLIPATEVITTNDAEVFVEGVADATEGPVIMWIGSRNQNHQIQQEIAQIAASHPNVILLIKNQPWYSEEHWMGIVEHVRAGGVPDDRIILCHRGFAPGRNEPNPEGWRNLPDLNMAMRVREKTGLPMLIDPSHIVGERDGVLPFAEEIMAWKDERGNRFDGAIIEVHQNPAVALTDAKQQVTWEAFGDALPHLRREISPRAHPLEILDKLREEIDTVDMRILHALKEADASELMLATRDRWKIVEQVGTVKRSHGRRSLDATRWQQVLEDRIAKGAALGLGEDEVRLQFERIHQIALEIEEGIIQ